MFEYPRFKRLNIIILTLFIILFTASGYAGNNFVYPRFKAIDGNGNPIRGGLLYSYIEGTSTAKDTYSDKECSAANTNPVVLDSNGEALVYLLGTYKFNLKTSSGGQVPGWPVDNIEGAAAAFMDFYYPDYAAADQGATGDSNTVKYYVDTIGATNKATIFLRHNSGNEFTDYIFLTSDDYTANTNINFVFENGARLAPATTKTVTIPSPENIIASDRQQIKTGAGTLAFATYGTVSPLWFGTNTVPGTTDMTSAWNQAVDAITIGGVIDAPIDNYYISAVIGVADTAGTQSNKYIIRGNNSIFTCAAALTDGVIRWGTTTLIGYPPDIQDLWLDTGLDLRADGSSNSIGIYITGRQRGKLQNVHVFGFATGFKIEGWDVAEGLIGCEAYFCTIGVDANNLNNGVNHGLQAFAIKDGLYAWNGIGIQISGGHAITISGNQINNNSDIGLWIGQHISEVTTMPTVTGNHFETNRNYDVRIGGATPVRGGKFTDNVNITGSTEYTSISYYVFNIQNSPEIGNNNITGADGNTTYIPYEYYEPYAFGLGVNHNSYNWIKNGSFYAWSSGISEVAPDNWALSNAYAYIGTVAPKESTSYSALLSQGTWAYLQQTFSSDDVLTLAGKYCTFGAWVKASDVNDKEQRLVVTDNLGTIYVSRVIPKDSAWHYMSVGFQTNPAITALYARAYVNYSAVADTTDVLYVSCATLREGNFDINFTPNPKDVMGILDISATWDAGSIANGAKEAKDITIYGAALGDFAMASFSLDVSDLVLDAQVTAANTVTCVLLNNTGGAIDLASATVYVRIWKR